MGFAPPSGKSRHCLKPRTSTSDGHAHLARLKWKIKFNIKMQCKYWMCHWLNASSSVSYQTPMFVDYINVAWNPVILFLFVLRFFSTYFWSDNVIIFFHLNTTYIKVIAFVFIFLCLISQSYYFGNETNDQTNQNLISSSKRFHLLFRFNFTIVKILLFLLPAVHLPITLAFRTRRIVWNLVWLLQKTQYCRHRSIYKTLWSRHCPFPRNR